MAFSQYSWTCSFFDFDCFLRRCRCGILPHQTYFCEWDVLLRTFLVSFVFLRLYAVLFNFLAPNNGQVVLGWIHAASGWGFWAAVPCTLNFWWILFKLILKRPCSPRFWLYRHLMQAKRVPCCSAFLLMMAVELTARRCTSSELIGDYSIITYLWQRYCTAIVSLLRRLLMNVPALWSLVAALYLSHNGICGNCCPSRPCSVVGLKRSGASGTPLFKRT